MIEITPYGLEATSDPTYQHYFRGFARYLFDQMQAEYLEHGKLRAREILRARLALKLTAQSEAAFHAIQEHVDDQVERDIAEFVNTHTGILDDLIRRITEGDDDKPTHRAPENCP